VAISAEEVVREKTDLLGTELLEMLSRIQSWCWARSDRSAAATSAQAVHEGP
jgi:hypothetical protein